MSHTEAFSDAVHETRKASKRIASLILHLKEHQLFREAGIPGVHDVGEAKANIMLAYRHAEDVGMRLGKVLQAMDGGVSVYDKGEA
jgi:hypothetical protein